MKRKDFILAVAFLIVCAMLPVGWAVAIDWIQYDERAVGENSPLYEDVVNRPAKQIFGLFTSEHYPDGTHRPLPYASSADLTNYMEIATYDANINDLADTAEALSDGANNSSAADVRGHLDDSSVHFLMNDGVVSSSSTWSSSRSYNDIMLQGENSVRGFTDSAYIAVATYGPSGWWSNNAFSLYGIVAPTNLNRSESFYRHLTADTSSTIVDVGKNASNQLYVSIGANTYVSGTVFTAETIGIPVEVGVVCDQVGGNLWFFFNGEVFSSQAATYTFPSIPAEVHGLGYNFIGDIFSWFITKSLIYPASSFHTPVSEGLAQCRGCLAHYDIDSAFGGAVEDRFGMIRNNYPRNLNMSGYWIRPVAGYK